MRAFQQMMRHPAGRMGITIGLTLGLIATVMGGASKALLFAGLCRLIASKMKRPI